MRRKVSECGTINIGSDYKNTQRTQIQYCSVRHNTEFFNRAAGIS